MGTSRRNMNTGWTFSALTLFKGTLLGVANIIPGVSGGTFALILGIYERILDALHAMDIGALKTLVSLIRNRFDRKSRSGFMELLRKLDAWFLACLAAGSIAAILALSFLIDWLLSTHPAITLSFFLGLIIPSIAVPWRMMDRPRSIGALLWILPGIILTVSVSFSFGKFSSSGDNLLWCFTTGAIAISAMILPGISGSFVMLVMGQYQNVLRKLQQIQIALASGRIDLPAWIWLGTFAVGCLAGLILFARLLKYLLVRYRTATLAFLIGLIIGSFWVLWPFKDYDIQPNLNGLTMEFQEKVAEKHDIRVATAPNRFPGNIPEVILNLLSFGIGIAGALGLNRMGKSEVSSYNA
ncbi:DUF368 domain-containing protein [bacterium]|nr:DUF368 domain-containing protein [candidate division CSSED10-310 bacterium]